jgi:hypothetical protein
MIVDRQWAKRNLGFDPISTPPPVSTYAFRAAAKSSSIEDIQRDIIDFDSESSAGKEFLAFSTTTGLSRFTDIPWPRGLAPKTGPAPRGGSDAPLPRADVLVVTWTVDEGHALSKVLTPGKDSHNDYQPYTHNYASISRKMRAGCPAREAKRLGAYWTTTINAKRAVIFKSDSHMSQDGPGVLPLLEVYPPILAQ